MNQISYGYFIVYKPFNMLCQFSKEPGKTTLADLDFKFPKDIYPVGRLDEDSEGLLLLTNDKKLNHQLLNPDFRHKRTYWAQVDGQITPQAIELLKNRVMIKLKNDYYLTLPAIAKIIPEPENLPERNPPVRFRKNIPTSWIELILEEGKNRQVRKMTASTGFPTLRLIRFSIERLVLDSLQPGFVNEVSREFLYERLGISLV